MERYEARVLMSADLQWLELASPGTCDRFAQVATIRPAFSKVQSTCFDRLIAEGELSVDAPGADAPSQAQSRKPHSSQSAEPRLDFSDTHFVIRFHIGVGNDRSISELDASVPNNRLVSRLVVIALDSPPTSRQPLTVIPAISSLSLPAPLGSATTGPSQAISTTLSTFSAQPSIQLELDAQPASEYRQPNLASVVLSTSTLVTVLGLRIPNATTVASTMGELPRAQPLLRDSSSALQLDTATNYLAGIWLENSAPKNPLTETRVALVSNLEGWVQPSSTEKLTLTYVKNTRFNPPEGSRQLRSSHYQGEQRVRAVDRMFRGFNSDLPIPNGMIWLDVQDASQFGAHEATDENHPLAASIDPFAAFQVFLIGSSHQLADADALYTDLPSTGQPRVEQADEPSDTITVDSLVTTLAIAAAWFYFSGNSSQTTKTEQVVRSTIRSWN